MKLKSTKSYYNLPVAHMQWFDKNVDGSPGPCAKWHGYDRSVHFEFSGEMDEHGWIVGFGDLTPVKSFLEYYYDHTALVSGDDPRLQAAIMAHAEGIVDLRVMPYCVSMEMSSLFIFEQVNPYIYSISNGRAYISRVECREHEKNSAFIEFDEEMALEQGKVKSSVNNYLLTKPNWDWVSPADAFAKYDK